MLPCKVFLSWSVTTSINNLSGSSFTKLPSHYTLGTNLGPSLHTQPQALDFCDECQIPLLGDFCLSAIYYS